MRLTLKLDFEQSRLFSIIAFLSAIPVDFGPSSLLITNNFLKQSSLYKHTHLFTIGSVCGSVEPGLTWSSTMKWVLCVFDTGY